MLQRPEFIEKIHFSFEISPIVALLGPRQCGKTTLARTFPTQAENYFDLDDPRAIARLEDPLLALEPLSGLIVIDEIQKQPELFPVLRHLVDKNPTQQYLILGSASRELIQKSSESLAGRIAYIELTPFTLNEVDTLDKLWLRGGFPRSYLAQTDAYSFTWRENYIRTYLEQDIPNLGISIPAKQLRRFWMMLCHYHGNIFNASELGRSLNISYNTAKRYLDILAATFMVRVLQPWHANISKRQVKSPKIYLRDSGILHALIDVDSKNTLYNHPQLGASWEGFALEQVIRQLDVDNEHCYFWATHTQAELDLLILHKGKKLGFEFKHTSQPKLTRSMQTAQKDLDLDQLTVIIPGKTNIQLSHAVQAIGLDNIEQALQPV